MLETLQQLHDLQHQQQQQQRQQQQQWQQQLSSSTGVSVAGRPASPTVEYSLRQLLLQQQAQEQAAGAAVGRLPEQRSLLLTGRQQQQLQRGTAPPVQVSDEGLLQRSFGQWLWVVRAKALLVRVFAGAESAWQARMRLDVLDVLDAGMC
jgi:hypothetical protein